MPANKIEHLAAQPYYKLGNLRGDQDLEDAALCVAELLTKVEDKVNELIDAVNQQCSVADLPDLTPKQQLMADYDSLCATGDSDRLRIVLLLDIGPSPTFIDDNAVAKVKYIEEHYDDNLKLIASPHISIRQWMLYRS